MPDSSFRGGANQLLRAHNRALAETVATKTELVSMLLHRLRTPLTSLSTAIQLLPTDDDPVTEMVHRAVHRLHEVIDDIATLAALESGTTPMAHEPVELPALVQAVADTWRINLAGRKKVSVDTTDGPPLYGDNTLLTTLLDRMMSVAAAAGNNGATIAVTVEVGEERWLIHVAVPGRMSSDRLFTSSADTDNAAALAYARAILARHGGRLRISYADGVLGLHASLPLRPESLLG